MNIIVLGLACALAACASPAGAAGRSVDYRQGDTVLQGYLTVTDTPGKKPAVIIIHDWNGPDTYEQRRAVMLADLGYVGFAADVYGKGVRPVGPEQSRAESSKYYSDPDLLLSRVQAAVDFVKTQPVVDASRIALIGYCFGGAAVLEYARSGAAVKGVASFHGGLTTRRPAKPDTVKARILVLHGAADTSVTPEHVAAFKKEMLDAKLGYSFVSYEGAVHGFTVPGERHHPQADKASWDEMKRFLKEIFAAT